MGKQKGMRVITWLVTIITGILWMPVVMMGIFKLKDCISQFESTSIGGIDAVNGPTAVSSRAYAFIGGVDDLILLGGMLILTILLWYRKIKQKGNI